MLYDPLQLHSLGFQFSFAVAAAILLFLSPIDELLQKAFKKRSLQEALSMPVADKHAYILLHILRQGVSLTLAVNLIAMPVTLFYFQKFPWMSLLFNLFFPFFVSIAMILLFAGIGLTFIVPYFGEAIHQFNNIYTQLMLNFTNYTPKAFDFYLRSPEIPAWLLLVTLTLFYCTGIYWKHCHDCRQQN